MTHSEGSARTGPQVPLESTRALLAWEFHRHDAIVDVTSYAQYTAFSDRLRALGLAEDTSKKAPLCRWRQGHMIVDVMPIGASVLGFSNRWYPMAIDTAQRVDIAGHDVRTVTPALFIPTLTSRLAA